MTSGLTLEGVGGALVRVRICRPPDNYFTVRMCSELSNLLCAPPIGARILLLEGARAVFCRGREAPGHADDAEATVAALARVTRSLRETALVTVAKVSGDAAGFGVGLASLCDVTLASEEARFWFPEVTHGLTPSLVLSWLPCMIGRRQAFWLAATGSVVSADEARSLGLVNTVTASTRLDQLAESVTHLLLAQPPAVHAAIKRDLRDFEQTGGTATSTMAVDRLLISTLRSFIEKP